MNVLKVKRLTETARLPTRAHQFDGGLDVYADCDATLCHGDEFPTIVQTGIAVEIQPGCAGIIKPRSGLTNREGVYARIAVIDAGFTGHMTVSMYTTRSCGYRVRKGDKIAQLLIVPVPLVEVVEADELTAWGTRGANGFGSSGK